MKYILPQEHLIMQLFSSIFFFFFEGCRGVVALQQLTEVSGRTGFLHLCFVLRLALQVKTESGSPHFLLQVYL